MGDFEKASRWYPITDNNLIKVHHQARMLEERDKIDDKSILFNQTNIIRIKEIIEFEMKIGYRLYIANRADHVQTVPMSKLMLVCIVRKGINYCFPQVRVNFLQYRH